MSAHEDVRASLVHVFQRGKMLRDSVLAQMPVVKKEALFPHPLIAHYALNNHRFASRVVKRLMHRFSLPVPYGISDTLAALIVCPKDTLDALVTKLGLLMILKQLPRLMKREDIETLNAVFGTSAVMFAMENRAIAPVWPHHIVRLPDQLVLHEQAVLHGWMSLLHWARQTQNDYARWFELCVPDFAVATPVSALVAEGYRQPVEKMLEELLQQPDEDADMAFDPHAENEESAYG